MTRNYCDNCDKEAPIRYVNVNYYHNESSRQGDGQTSVNGHLCAECEVLFKKKAEAIRKMIIQSLGSLLGKTATE